MNPRVHATEPWIEGEHYRRLSAREGKGRYRFALLQDVTFVYPQIIMPIEQRVSFRDAHDHEWMRMTCKTQTIREDYWWNGNTPKRGIMLMGFSLWLGTPDFRGTIPASGKHDPDFQFRKCEHYPFKWEEVNHHYLDIASGNGFCLARTYHGALKDFSKAAWDAPGESGLRSIIL